MYCPQIRTGFPVTHASALEPLFYKYGKLAFVNSIRLTVM